MKKTMMILLVLIFGGIGAVVILHSGQAKPSGAHDDHGDGAGADAGGGHDEHAGHGEEKAASGGHDEHGGGDRIEMTDAVARSSGIRLLAAGSRQVSGALDLPGEIMFNENRAAHIVAQFSGRVVETHKNVGDRVSRGEVLAVLEVPEMARHRSEHLALLSKIGLAKDLMDREEGLWQKRIAPERRYLEARQAYEQLQIEERASAQELMAMGLSAGDLVSDKLSRFSLRAPLGGTLMEKHLAFGEAVSPGDPLLLVADLSSVWARVALHPRHLVLVRIGDTVVLRADVLDAATTGRIARIGSGLGPQTRSIPAFVELSNPRGVWRPGLFVTVSIAQGVETAPIAVREDAIQTVEGKPTVFVREGSSFEARHVRVGRSGDGWIEILSGVAAGEAYAVGNTFLLKAELGKAGAAHDH